MCSYISWAISSTSGGTRLVEICGCSVIGRRCEVQVEAADNFCMEMPEEVIRQALAVEPRAHVELGEERVIVRLHVFSKWGGLYRATYQLGSGPIPGVLSQQSDNLVEYYCPVVF